MYDNQDSSDEYYEIHYEHFQCDEIWLIIPEKLRQKWIDQPPNRHYLRKMATLEKQVQVPMRAHTSSVKAIENWTDMGWNSYDRNWTGTATLQKSFQVHNRQYNGNYFHAYSILVPEDFRHFYCKSFWVRLYEWGDLQAEGTVIDPCRETHETLCRYIPFWYDTIYQSYSTQEGKEDYMWFIAAETKKNLCDLNTHNERVC